MAHEGKIDMFEHLKDPFNVIPLETAYRLWRVLPFFSQHLTDRMVNLLKEKGFWRQTLKQDFNGAIKHIKPASDSLVNKLFAEEEGDTFVPLNFEEAMCEKFLCSFLDYYEKIIRIADVAEEADIDTQTQKYIDNIAKQAQFMITLNKGDIFTFADTGKYEEFTYNGHYCKGNEVICEYISNNEEDGPTLYTCHNIWKPCINMSVKGPTKEDIDYINKKRAEKENKNNKKE